MVSQEGLFTPLSGGNRNNLLNQTTPGRGETSLHYSTYYTQLYFTLLHLTALFCTILHHIAL